MWITSLSMSRSLPVSILWPIELKCFLVFGIKISIGFCSSIMSIYFATPQMKFIDYTVQNGTKYTNLFEIMILSIYLKKKSGKCSDKKHKLIRLFVWETFQPMFKRQFYAVNVVVWQAEHRIRIFEVSFNTVISKPHTCIQSRM